jgi:hypothetical protein
MMKFEHDVFLAKIRQRLMSCREALAKGRAAAPRVDHVPFHMARFGGHPAHLDRLSVAARRRTLSL